MFTPSAKPIVWIPYSFGKFNVASKVESASKFFIKLTFPSKSLIYHILLMGGGGIWTHDHRCVRADIDDGFVHKLKRVLSSTIDEKIVQRELQLYENYLCMLNRSSSTIKDRIIYLRKFLYSVKLYASI